MRRVLPAVGLAGVCLAVAGPVDAQIYTWRDANGHLVLSNRPLLDAVRAPKTPTAPAAPQLAYAVPQAEAIRTTRVADPNRSRLYDDLIVEHAERHGIRTDLVRAVIQVESAYNPYAKSPKGALGLMQLMPATIQRFGVTNPFNPQQNVQAGTAYLRQLLDRYQDNEELALAAYNAGPGAVDRHGQSVPPYRETQQYVTRINAMAARPVQARGNGIYKTTEVINGRTVFRYSDRRPPSEPYELVGR